MDKFRAVEVHRKETPMGRQRTAQEWRFRWRDERRLKGLLSLGVQDPVLAHRLVDLLDLPRNACVGLQLGENLWAEQLEEAILLERGRVHVLERCLPHLLKSGRGESAAVQSVLCGGGADHEPVEARFPLRAGGARRAATKAEWQPDGCMHPGIHTGAVTALAIPGGGSTGRWGVNHSAEKRAHLEPHEGWQRSAEPRIRDHMDPHATTDDVARARLGNGSARAPCNLLVARRTTTTTTTLKPNI